MIKLKNMRWVRFVASMDEKRDAYMVLVGKSGRKCPRERPRRIFDF
jgi:hypothetical protein